MDLLYASYDEVDLLYASYENDEDLLYASYDENDGGPIVC